MPFLTNVPLPQCLQHSSATRCLLALDHDRGCTRYLLKVKCLKSSEALDCLTISTAPLLTDCLPQTIGYKAMADKWVGNTPAELMRANADADGCFIELEMIRCLASLIAERAGWELVETTRAGVSYRAPDGSLLRFAPHNPVFIGH